MQPSVPVAKTLTLANGARGKIIHLHGDGKVLKVVEKLEEGSKLIKGDSLKCHKTHMSSNKVGEKREMKPNLMNTPANIEPPQTFLFIVQCGCFLM